MSSKIVDKAGPPRTRQSRGSLAVRLTCWYTASSFVLVTLAVSFLYWVLVSTLDHEDDQYLFDKIAVLRMSMRNSDDTDRELREEIMRESGPRPTGHVYLRVINSDGVTIAETTGMSEQLPLSLFAHAVKTDHAANHTFEVTSSTGREFRALAVDSGDSGRIIHVAMDRSAEEEVLFRYRIYSIATIVASLGVCAWVGYLIARRGMRPIDDVTRATRRVQSTNLGERIAETELPAELAGLAANFNAMLGRLEGSFQRLDQFSADIAHELRTPVNNLRGEAEVALSRGRSPSEYCEVLSSSLEELGRLSGLIDSLLFLARAESPNTVVNRQALDIGREMSTVAEYHRAAAQEAGINLINEVPEGLTSPLDRTMFQRAVSNLLVNALDHTSRGGTITIHARREGKIIRVEVTDTGIGIAPEHLPQVFDRFYRADPSRATKFGTAGLGLALVKSIAMLHGGTVDISSVLGRGTTVSMDVPVE